MLSPPPYPSLLFTAYGFNKGLNPLASLEAVLLWLEDVVIVLAGMPGWLLVHSGNTMLYSGLFPLGQVVCLSVAGTPLGVWTTVLLPREDTYCSGLLLCLQQGWEPVGSTLISELRA